MPPAPRRADGAERFGFDAPIRASRIGRFKHVREAGGTGRIGWKPDGTNETNIPSENIRYSTRTCAQTRIRKSLLHPIVA